jgi:glycerol-3-phosphate O-acyltransferase
MDAGCVIRFSQPLDCFGNEVDEQGLSHDARGRVVDPMGYVTGKEGRPVRDSARDAQYTRELGDVIVEAYKRDTVVMATHLAAACAFERLARIVGKRGDLFAMLRHKDDVVVPRDELADDIARLRDRARAMEAEKKIVLADQVANASGEAILLDALRAFHGYHTSEVLEERGRDLVLADTRLLFYYQNRLAAHGLGVDLIAPRPTSPARAAAAAG